VVEGRNSCSTGDDAQVFVHGLLDTKCLMKVVNSIKMKPPEVALREVLSVSAVHRRLRRDELSSSCMSLRKSH
jgi:hypothetical protein